MCECGRNTHQVTDVDTLISGPPCSHSTFSECSIPHCSQLSTVVSFPSDSSERVSLQPACQIIFRSHRFATVGRLYWALSYRLRSTASNFAVLTITGCPGKSIDTLLVFGLQGCLNRCQLCLERARRIGYWGWTVRQRRVSSFTSSLCSPPASHIRTILRLIKHIPCGQRCFLKHFQSPFPVPFHPSHISHPFFNSVFSQLCLVTCKESRSVLW